MNAEKIRSVSKFLPCAALVLVSGLAQAIEPPRVMFVSGVEVKPVLIDLQGKEIPAKKGQIIPPGYSVKVPEGATVQIMTDEKAIVAVRQNSLLKLEKLGDGAEPHKFKLDTGGLRVANSDKKPHKFEVDTPNAKIRFDKGDHEAFYLKEGKLKDGRWGTFVRGFKDESVLSTKDGDTTIDRSKYGYVAGMTKDAKPELLDRVKVGGAFNDLTTVIPAGGTTGEVLTSLNANQRQLSDNAKSTTPDPASTPLSSRSKPDLLTLPDMGGKLPRDLPSMDPIKPIPPVARFVDPVNDFKPPIRPLPPDILVLTKADGSKAPVGIDRMGSLLMPGDKKGEVQKFDQKQAEAALKQIDVCTTACQARVVQKVRP